MKALHVASVLIFVGGLVAQTVAIASLRIETGSTLEAVERWDRRVTTPALFATWLLGIVIAVQGAFFTSGWLMAKLAIVLALSSLHGIQAGRLRRAVYGQPGAIRRMTDRMPLFVLMALIAIAILAVAKPF
ncbi:CopD family protein [Aureimonas sp. AU20]|uniref:CopD family protein n=1 Tax=Aureimonas sp. AU20 TaxID=1349819 RepID=UPI001651132C|nr:CopD family protein [Aureimonas sp. AU20]